MVEDVTAVIIPEQMDLKTSPALVNAFTRQLLDFSSKLAHFKNPKYIRIVNEFPMTANGKVKKNTLRDVSNALLKEQSPEMIKFSPSKNKEK
jgi:non-ribosomal peptide synthetase component E (peptide arylation enzyme)